MRRFLQPIILLFLMASVGWHGMITMSIVVARLGHTPIYPADVWLLPSMVAACGVLVAALASVSNPNRVVLQRRLFAAFLVLFALAIQFWLASRKPLPPDGPKVIAGAGPDYLPTLAIADTIGASVALAAALAVGGRKRRDGGTVSS